MAVVSASRALIVIGTSEAVTRVAGITRTRVCCRRIRARRLRVAVVHIVETLIDSHNFISARHWECASAVQVVPSTIRKHLDTIFVTAGVVGFTAVPVRVVECSPILIHPGSLRCNVVDADPHCRGTSRDHGVGNSH